MPAYARNFSWGSVHSAWTSVLPKRRVDSRASRFGRSVVMIDSKLLSVISWPPGKVILIDLWGPPKIMMLIRRIFLRFAREEGGHSFIAVCDAFIAIGIDRDG